MRKVRILSIDGGGIRGILPGVILEQIEYKLQKQTGNPSVRLADYFDFFAGTSTGGILSLAYLVPNKKGRPKLSAREAVEIYLKKGDQIFDIDFWQHVKSIGGLIDEKYSADALEKALNTTFGNVTLEELVKPCIISAYDIKNAKPHFFKQHRSNEEGRNFKVKDVARATSAAPTYFEAAYVDNESNQLFPLIDGGVFVNNPALVAYSEVRNMLFRGIDYLPTAKDMMIVSIGTGSKSKPYDYEAAKDWGMIQWIKPIIEIMMSGNATTVDYHLQQIYATLSSKDQADYHRLEPQVQKASIEMDCATPDNMALLQEDALSFVAQKEINKELDTIVEKLIGYG